MKCGQDVNTGLLPYNHLNKTSKSPGAFPSVREHDNTASISHTNTFKENRRSASMSSFIDRNYTKYFNRQQVKFNAIQHVIDQDQLNTILTRLKRYYNEVLEVTQNRQSEVTMLTNQHQSLQFLKDQTIAYDDIVLPHEKVCIKMFQNQKITKEEIEGKILDDMKEINDLREKAMNEMEYSKTIEFMYNEEKKKLQKVLDDILATEHKLHSINNFRRTIDANLFQTNKKKENAEILMSQLEEDIDLIDSLYQNQQKESSKLDKEIVKKEAYIVKLKADIHKRDEERKMIFEREKQEIIDKIAIINDKIDLKFKTEQNYIRTILCLNIIQKYFIEPEEFNMRELVDSKEYKEIITDKYTIVDNNGSNNHGDGNDENRATILFNNHVQHSKRSDSYANNNSNTNRSHSKSAIFRNEEMKQSSARHSINEHKANHNSSTYHPHHKKMRSTNDNFNNTAKTIDYNKIPLSPGNHPKASFISRKSTKFLYSPNNSNAPVIKEARMTLDELMDRYEQIYINRNDMYQYYYNTIDRIRFYRNNVIHCNDKQITLENKKDNYYKRVKTIISKDYKNFVDLIQHNSRFKEFMMRNKGIITDAKEKHHIEKSMKINKGFNNKEENSFEKEIVIPNPYNSTTNSNPSLKGVEFQANELFRHGDRLFREIKSFFEGIIALFSLQQRHFLEESKRKFHKIKKIKPQLNSCVTVPFHEYVLQLFDFIYTTEPTLHLESIINEICGSNSILASLKNEIFFKGNIDAPNKEFIAQMLSKSLANESMLFHLLQKDKETITTLKLAFEFSFKRHKTEAKEIAPLIIKKDVMPIKEPLIVNKLYAIKNKGGNKGKHHKTQRESFINNDDDDSYSEKDTNQTENKIIKPKHNIVEERIIENLYNPTLSKTFYNRRLNDHMSIIKGMTRSNSKDNHLLYRKKNEVDDISHSLLIYNNPKININDLSNNTYNTIVSYILANQSSYKKLNTKIDQYS